jgi:hypothetical protein
MNVIANGFTKGIYYDARTYERQIGINCGYEMHATGLTDLKRVSEKTT